MSDAPAKSRAGLYAQGLLCGVAVALLPGAALLGVVLLLPVLAAAFLVPEQHRSAIRPALLLSLATTVGPMRQLWDGGGTVEAALDLCEPTTLGLSWLAAGGGWVIVELAATLGSIANRTAIQRKVKALNAERALLETEWGKPDGPA